MNTKSQMPIREFSLLTGISKDNLRFYDKIGLLSPECRGENGYRYYTVHQVDLAFLIGDLRAIGIGLEEIRRYAAERSPERMMSLFREQDARIEAEIERLRSLQELMRLRSDMAAQALRFENDAVVLEEKEREPIFLCPPQDLELSQIEQLTYPYEYGTAHGVNVSFPLGAVITQAALQTGNLTYPSQYYFKDRKNHNTWKSAGTYAVYYGPMATEPVQGLFQPLLAFIRENGLHIQGNAYVENPLDELSTLQWDQYKMRAEVRVTK